LPLALKVPQVPAGAQDQVTPPFAESWATVAVIGSVLFTTKLAGVELSVTVIGADAAEMVMAAVLAIMLVSSVTVAVMITLAGGTVAGAV
jgi:hypothetical protein